MKAFIILFLVLIHVVPLHAQLPNSDSLKRLIATTNNDTIKLQAYETLVWKSTWSDPIQALQLAKEELLWARKSSLVSAEAAALSSNAVVFSVLGDYRQAIDYYLQSIRQCERLGLRKTLPLVYLNISESYSDAGDYDNAILYAYKGKNMTDTAHYSARETAFRNMLGLTYIGEVYEKFGKLDSALFYLRQARAIDSIYLDKKTGFTTLHLANVYAKKNHSATALQYYRETVINSKLNDYQSDLMDAYNGMAKTFEQNGQTDSAIFYSKQTILIGQRTAYPLATLHAVTLLSGIYQSKGKLDSTVKYMGLSILIKDSLFNREKVRGVQDISFNEQLYQQELQQKIKQSELQYKSRLSMYILLAGLLIVVVVAVGLWRRNIFKQKSFALLQKQKLETDRQKGKAEQALEELRNAQSQLIQSEKMASLGELTAGIAHEIQNPLNFVNNFSDVNRELIDEMQQELDHGNLNGAKAISNDIKENESKINHHGKRADAIVKGMLQHSRSGTGIKEPVSINALIDECLRLSYHGYLAKDKEFHAQLETNFDSHIEKIPLIQQDIVRVLVNIFNNAFYAMNEKRRQNSEHYEPALQVSTIMLGDKIEIRVKDNGNGIPEKLVDKIFQPFFTTKPNGVGTGLGLSLSYDTIKAHGGELKVNSKLNEFSEFIIQFPKTT